MTDYFEIAARGIEAVGVSLLLVGLLVALMRWALLFFAGDRSSAYRGLRCDVGRALLLALEFLVASDIIYTVAVDLTLDTLGTLGLLILIRTFLSFTLELEITGRLPWQKRAEAPGS